MVLKEGVSVRPQAETRWGLARILDYCSTSQHKSLVNFFKLMINFILIFRAKPEEPVSNIKNNKTNIKLKSKNNYIQIQNKNYTTLFTDPLFYLPKTCVTPS